MTSGCTNQSIGVDGYMAEGYDVFAGGIFAAKQNAHFLHDHKRWGGVGWGGVGWGGVGC